MKKNFTSAIALSMTLAISPLAGHAQVILNPETGHYFEVVPANGISWATAKSQADSKSFMGVPGHLATITSEAEDIFVEFEVRQQASLARPEVWVGGSQDAGSSSTKGEGWKWEGGEGAISTPDVPLPSYSNWLTPEPNDNTGPGSENELAIGLGGQFGWNDEGALGNIGGYIVEYDVPREAGECSTAEEGCETISGHNLTFPENSIPGGAQIPFNAFEFTDDPARCGISPLVIFGDDTDPDKTKPDLIIPPYLCGSPKFVVISVDSSELSILDGTVFVENETDVVLPSNLYVCDDPIVQNFPTDGDPQFQDVVVWQTTDPLDMLELDSGVGGIGQFAGAAGEFTNECGSSRARVKGASYYVVGMHIDFGPGNTWAETTAGNHERFVALTRYKLTLLQQSVANARDDGALQNGDYTKMKQQVKTAIKNLDQGDPVSALDHVNNFLKFVDKANYTLVPDENHNGEHLMRGSNIEFMLRVKVIPYAP